MTETIPIYTAASATTHNGDFILSDRSIYNVHDSQEESARALTTTQTEYI